MVRVHHYTPFHKTSYKTVQSQKMSEFLHNINLYSFKQKKFLWLQVQITLIRQFPETSILKIFIHKHVNAVQCNLMFLLNQYIQPNTQ